MVEVILVFLAVAVGITLAMRMDVEPRRPPAPTSSGTPAEGERTGDSTG